MMEWNDSFVHWYLFWMKSLPKGVMVVHQLPPYSEIVQFGDGHGNMMRFFFFFLAVMALGVSPSAVIT